MRLLLLAAVPVLAGCAHSSGSPNAAEAEILAVEQARLAAFRADDKPAFSRLVADDLTFVHSGGQLAGKADQLAVMRPSTPERPLPTLHLEETNVRAYGDAGVITGALVERQGERVLLRLRFTNTYVRRHGSWLLVAGQLTRAQP
ncbi:MAG TPA: nuclear transport factor 2 family protein [Allosphingosinicella sp.]|jgi:ketosteroid isomerase-like protein|nr:nuclear transport factor 2 family protein [Allosphingosinicella sp.]